VNDSSRPTDGRPGRPGSGNTETATPAGQSLRTLLVEDNHVDARLTQEGLRDCDNGIDCDIATSLREVSAQRLATVDCAIVDLGLPSSAASSSDPHEDR